jgi:thiamine kinase-like enzyme
MVENIYQYNFTTQKVKIILNKNYSLLGKVSNLKLFKNNGQNSIIFYFNCNKNKYLIKIIPEPNKIYGKKNSQRRIATITNIITKLSKKYEIEKFIKNDFDKYTTNYKKSILRVTKYIEHKDNNFSLKDSIKILNHVHEEFWNKLSVRDKEKLKYLRIPYDLDYSLKKKLDIKNFFNKEIKKNKNNIYTKNIKKIMKKYTLLVKWAGKLKRLKKQKFFYKKTFTHNDFHPENIVLDTKNRIHLLDFDNIQYSKTFRCLYLFLLRFAFYKTDINLKNLKYAYEMLNKNYYTEIPNYHISLKFLLYVEIEKIFKILCRVSESNGLEIFIKKIIRVHLPNVIFLINQIKNEQ